MEEQYSPWDIDPMSPHSIRLRDKYEWPEVVGKEGTMAEQVIKEENTSLQPEMIGEGMAVSPDFQVNRVRIFLDDTGRVKEPPHIGWTQQPFPPYNEILLW